MEYSREEFPPEATAEDINAAIARGIAIDPETIDLPDGSWGFRLAEGLPRFLWACPSCFAHESLNIPKDRDCVSCSACSRTWRVDLATRMVGETADTGTWTVAAAKQRLVDHFTTVGDVGCERMVVTQVRRGQLRPEPIAEGAARLGPDGLEVLVDDEVVWRLPYADMSAVLLQFRNALQVRTEDANYQLDPEGQSTLRWHHFLALECKGLVG